MKVVLFLLIFGVPQGLCLGRKREFIRFRCYKSYPIDEDLQEQRQDAKYRRSIASSSNCRKRGPDPKSLAHHRSAEQVRSSGRKLDAAVTVGRTSSFQEHSVASSPRSRMWPPWPFNLLSRDRSQQSSSQSGTSQSSDERPAWTGASILMDFLTQSAKGGLRNLQYSTSQLLFHLPPAAPPLILLACLPHRLRIQEQMTKLTEQQAAPIVRAVIIPLVSDPFARNAALSFLGLAVMSWAHSQIHRKRVMTPLPLAPEYQDINKAALPPFLPEEERHAYLEAVTTALENEDESDTQTLYTSDREAPDMPKASNLLLWNPFWEGSTKPPRTLQATWVAWRNMRRSRKREHRNAHRMAIMDQLIALQKLKKNAEKKRLGKKRKISLNNNHKHDLDGKGSDLGYAVVTGASRGIGRAIAVELSRWGIPLILVARDIDRLTSLAFDLEACYGIDCCVLQADLTKPGVGEAVYQAVRDAGLPVDILVNNAGFSSQGISVDLPMRQVDEMIALNVQAVSTLSHLFGKDMKERRRGRILIVSSICGAVSGIPTVAVYSATKAFEKTLSTSMAKEMEPYGVGVTCLLPGAVRDTEFKSRSKSEEALCWKLPFYLKTPPQIAEMGVRAMLRGESEVTPGWLNRVFLKVMQPALPPRIHSLVAEIMWNPLHLPLFNKGSSRSDASLVPAVTDPSSSNASKPETSTRSNNATQLPLRYKFESAPRLLKIEDYSLPSSDSHNPSHPNALAADDDGSRVPNGTQSGSPPDNNNATAPDSSPTTESSASRGHGSNDSTFAEAEPLAVGGTDSS